MAFVIAQPPPTAAPPRPADVDTGFWLWLAALPLLVIGCLVVLRPLKGWLVAEQYVHKAAPPEFSSIGKHGEGSKWR